MRFFVNLTDGAVSMGLYDGVHVASGWQTKSLGSETVEIQFHTDGVPALLGVGVPILFGCKPSGNFTDSEYLTSVTGFTAPASASGYYTALLPLSTTPIIAALAGNVASIPETECEIQWWPNGGTNPPVKSQEFSIAINNTPNQGNETDPPSSTPYPSPDTLQAAVGAVTSRFTLTNRTTGTQFFALLDGATDAGARLILLPLTDTTVPAITAKINPQGQLTLLNRTTGNFLPFGISGEQNAFAIQPTGQVILPNLTTGELFSVAVDGPDNDPYPIVL